MNIQKQLQIGHQDQILNVLGQSTHFKATTSHKGIIVIITIIVIIMNDHYFFINNIINTELINIIIIISVIFIIILSLVSPKLIGRS